MVYSCFFFFSFFITRDGKRQLIQNCLIQNHMHMTLSIALIDASMFFWKHYKTVTCEQCWKLAKESWRWRKGPKCGFISLRKMTTELINVCKIISNKGGNGSNIHHSTQHSLKFQECHVFDTLLPNRAACLILRVHFVYFSFCFFNLTTTWASTCRL